MAKISYPGLDKYQSMLADLSKDVNKMAHYAIYPAAGLVLDTLKANTPVDSGDLRDSEILTHFVDETDESYTTIVFDGYDRNGVPNSLKARTLESGRSNKNKHPFIRPTLRQVNQMVIDTIDQKIQEYCEMKMEES
jgi:HK97 gp10 family phage protein